MLAVFVLVLIWQIRTIADSPYPAIRAIETLALVIPLFVLLFAGAYYVLSTEGSGSFSQASLTRTDSMYLSVTIFSTVGFGDITPTSQTARAVVSGQMVLDLLIVGFGIKAIFGLARFGKKRQEGSEDHHVTSP